jgi:SAM-dependent methyltransferase
MKWEEIEYFLEKYSSFLPWKKILDVWCGSWRLLEHFINAWIKDLDYTWIDASSWMIEEAKKNFSNERFLVWDMLDLENIIPPPSLPLAGEESNSPPARGESRWIEFTQEIVPWGIEGGFDFIFFIASFHHLDSLEKRERLMSNLKNILNKNWIVFMTNWALKSEVNFEKYKDDEIKNSQNQFWALDFNIKFWEYLRYYHCFSLEELEYLIKKPWFQIIENRLFDSKKNFISTFGL